MRKATLPLALGLFLLACSKGNDPVTPDPVVNNGPIGGNYSLTAVTQKQYDTIPGTGILTIREYNFATTNIKGTLAITGASMTSKGLVYDFTRTGTTKEVNTANGQTVTTTHSPTTGTVGVTTSSYSSNYTIDATAKTVTVADAQYIFNPAFIMLPSNKTYFYATSGNTLTVTSVHYDATNKSRTISESIFTKQ